MLLTGNHDVFVFERGEVHGHHALTGSVLVLNHRVPHIALRHSRGGGPLAALSLGFTTPHRVARFATRVLGLDPEPIRAWYTPRVRRTASAP